MKSKFAKFICVGLLLIICISVLFACNKDDNFRNERNGEPEAGAFYSLQTAYDNGWICRNDLRNIAYHRTGDAQKKGFVPTAKNPEVLSAETELAIKEAYIRDLRENYNDTVDINLDGVSIDAYYGEYEGFIAIMISGYYGYMDVITEDNVGGVKFIYSNSNTMSLWKQ